MLAPLPVGYAQVVVRKGIVRLQTDGFLVGGDGGIVLALFLIGIAEVVVRVCKVWLETDGFLVGGDGASYWLLL